MDVAATVAVEVEMLEQLRAAAGPGEEALPEAEFVSRYRGSFLVPMGLLAVEREVPRGVPRWAEERRQRRQTVQVDVEALERRDTWGEPTTRVVFGKKLASTTGGHPLAGKVFFLPQDAAAKLTMGRGDECDLVVPDDSVSARHCTLRWYKATLLVTDLCSTNGTWVDRSRLTPAMPVELDDGQLVNVGRYSFQVYSAKALFRDLRELGEAG